jgi:hypothetical protein
MPTKTQDRALWFGTYPYAKGKGGISIIQTLTQKKLLGERILDLLSKPPTLGSCPKAKVNAQ